MSIRNSLTEGVSFMFDSTSCRAFGPGFESESELDDFLEYAADHTDIDLRMMSSDMLDALVEEWSKDVEAERG